MTRSLRLPQMVLAAGLATALTAFALPAAAQCGAALTLPAAGSTVAKGKVKGDKTCDFALKLKAGQVVDAELAGPAGFEVVTFGAVEHDFGAGPFTAPQDGTYTIRVLQTRNAARKHPESRGFRLTLSTPKVEAAKPAAPAALAAGTKGLPAKGTMCLTNSVMSSMAGGGAPSGTMSGQIDGNGTCDFNFTANAGERLMLVADADPRLAIQLVKPVAATLIPGASFVLPVSGTYTMRVLQPKAAQAQGGAPRPFSILLGFR